MKTYLTLGASPCEEACAQVGQPDYAERSRAECRAWKRQLERTFPSDDDYLHAWFDVRSFAHDLGTYREVVVNYTPDNEAACSFAAAAEEESPCTWDDEARAELAAAGFPVREEA